MIATIRSATWLYAIALLVVLVAGAVVAGCSQAAGEPPANATYTRVFKNVTPAEASELIGRSNISLIVLDVRTAAEFAEGHLEGAVNIDYYQDTFRSGLDKLDKGRAYLVYCRTARRSTDASNIMKGLGFQEVYNMLGGIERWNQEGRPVVR